MKAFNLQDEDGINHNVVLSVTKIDLNAFKRDMTQQQTDATYVMVHKLDNSTQLHTVYLHRGSNCLHAEKSDIRDG